MAIALDLEKACFWREDLVAVCGDIAVETFEVTVECFSW
jgi:hypothetical protein